MERPKRLASSANDSLSLSYSSREMLALTVLRLVFALVLALAVTLVFRFALLTATLVFVLVFIAVSQLTDNAITATPTMSTMIVLLFM